MPAPKGNSNTTKHYMFAGIDKLPVEQINHLSELRRLVRSTEGRLEARQELAARCLLIVNLGFAELAKQDKAGENIFESPVMRYMQGFMAESRRQLNSFTDEEMQDSSAEIISHMVDNEDKNDAKDS